VVALGMGLAALVNGLLNSAPAAVKNAANQAATAMQQSAAEVVKEVKNIPGVKQAENVVTTAVTQAAVEQAVGDFLQQTAGGSQQPAQQTVKGEKSPAVVKDKGEKQVGGADTSSYIPGVSELVHGAMNNTDTKTVTTSQGGEKTTTPVDQSAETEAEKQARADAQARGTFDAFLQETPESSKQPPTAADKVIEDVFQATDYEKAQQNAQNLMAEYLAKYQEFKDKRRQGDWAFQNRSREPEADHSISDALAERLHNEADQLEKEARELEKKFQEAVKQLGASDTSRKGKSK
jgi:hypothetical protein